MRVRQLFISFFQALKNIYKQLKIFERYLFRVEELDIQKEMVALKCRGSHIILRLSILEVISDPAIISNIPPKQACWVGYYCGKFCKEDELENGKLLSNPMKKSFSLRFLQGKYKISSIDRKGNVTYTDIHSNVSYTECPFNIVQNESVILHFDPSQACYIGILAGMRTPESYIKQATVNKTKPVLRLVK